MSQCCEDGRDEIFAVVPSEIRLYRCVMKTRLSMGLAVLLLPFMMAHGDGGGCGGGGGSIDFGPPTGATCPEDGTDLTYDNFAKKFFEDYCLRCHSVDVSGDAREGAPSDHNFDTRFEALAFKDHIDWMTGSGPEATNEQMPIGDPTPTLEERQQLSEWLACDAPE